MSKGTKPGSMREAMPFTASVIDELRRHLGPESVDPSIREGMAGQPRFWASENGHQVGTPIELGPDSFVLDAQALAIKAREVRAEAAARAANALKGGR